MKDLQFTLINMRQLTKIDVILHKVGINTNCYKYWQLPRAEEVIKKLEYCRDVRKYREMCIEVYEGITYDFRGEFDMYLNKGMTPYEAWNEVMVEFVWK